MTTTRGKRKMAAESLAKSLRGVRFMTPSPVVTDAEYSPAVKQAFGDWIDHRAYLDNGGNYRVRPEPATPTHRPSGKIAPWNREVKRLFADSAEFHRAAQEWKERSEGR